MAKNIQIPESLFVNLCRYFLLSAPLEPEEIADIENGLSNKLEAIMRHDLYSQYKDKALSDSQRQEARKKYLDSVGMREGYRWDSLEPPI